MIITIHGRAGSGKSAVAKLLAKKLGFTHFSMGDMRRRMAHERGMTLAEFNKLGEKESFTDREVDDFQKELGRRKDNIVIDGRTCFHFIPHSFKIYLDADPEVRAKRVFMDNRHVEGFRSIEDTKKALAERELSDKKRYKKYYNINVYDKRHFDMIIDTTNLSVEEVVKKILKSLKKRQDISK